MRVLIFTASYPYSKASEDTFLKHELTYLLDSFEELFIIPLTTRGEKAKVNNQIIIDESLAKSLEQNKSFIFKIFNGLNIRLIKNEVKAEPGLVVSPKRFIKLLLNIDKVKQIQKWFEESEYYTKTDILVYTYWFTHVTSYFAVFKRDFNVVSRVHGTDLYIERNNGYIPLRNQAIENIDYIYCISKAGINYLESKYPKYAEKYKLARLGVKNDFENNTIVISNENNVFRIVSCSSIIPLKRVDLILEGVINFAVKNINLKIEYVHFGDGILIDDIREIKNNNECSNLSIIIHGNISNDKLLKYYSENYVNVFINASTTEGIPVTIQEAQSFGIPCIGTNVGGIPEIVNDNNGKLLSANPTKNDIAEAISHIYKLDKSEQRKLRENSYMNWKQSFNADINFKSFAEEIRLL